MWYKEYEIEIVFDQYKNDNTAIFFEGKKGTKDAGDIVNVATVNGSIDFAEPDIVGFKSWDLDPFWFLMRNGFVDNVSVNQELSHDGMIYYFRLTEKGEQMRKEQFDAKSNSSNGK